MHPLTSPFFKITACVTFHMKPFSPPGCQVTTSPICHHGILKVYHQTLHEHFIVTYLSLLLNFFWVMPCHLVVCLPKHKVQCQVYRKCLINSCEVNKERNDVGEAEFCVSLSFLFVCLMQYLILLEIHFYSSGLIQRGALLFFLSLHVRIGYSRSPGIMALAMYDMQLTNSMGLLLTSLPDGPTLRV